MSEESLLVHPMIPPFTTAASSKSVYFKTCPETLVWRGFEAVPE
jgi:hypothetical protein